MVISSRNPFFNNYSSFQESDLLESLIVESHSICAPQMYYIPRVLNNEDRILTADDQSSYESSFLIPIYIENFDSFNGDGNFMSKFGLEIRNQIQLSVAVRTFAQEIGTVTGQVRPNEGDIVFFPQNKHVFVIHYVEKFEMFYPLGKLYVWQLTAELFEYSNERFVTGIPEVDQLQLDMSTNILDYLILTEDGYALTNEADHYIVAESYNLDDIKPGNNEDFQEEATDIFDFTKDDPFSEGNLTDS